MIEKRFIYRGNAVGIGGRIVRIDPKSDLDIPIPVQGASSLPVVGGVSMFKPAKCVIPLMKRSKQNLVSAQSVTTSAQSDVERRGKPFVTRVSAEIKMVRVLDSISIKRVLLNLTSTHNDGDEYPRISLGDSEITGLKLGKFPVEVKIDRRTFETFDTKQRLAGNFAENTAFRTRNAKRFNTPPEERQVREYGGGYIVTSIVESISGKLPEGAYMDEDGYTIVWPGVGKIVLGEMLVTHNSRRLTMVRVQLGSPIEGFAAVGEGDVNGGSVP